MKDRPLSFIILATLLCIALPVSATTDTFSNNYIPKITFSHFSTNEGLSQGTVVSSCQDKFGRMWFATHDGLNMFDGHRFTIYKNV